MRLVLSFLLLAGAAGAQPVIKNVFVDTIDSHCARFGWTTSAPTTRNYIKIDTAAPPAATRIPDGADFAGLEHGYTLCGLAAATEYHYSLCGTAGTETCTPPAKFTTLPAQPGFATLPKPPTMVPDAIPVINGGTFSVAADCSDLQAKLNAAARATPTQNHQVVIPAGTTCLGRYVLPDRKGATGWVWVRTAGTIPPPGARTSLEFAVDHVRIISPFVAVEHYQTNTPGPGGEVGRSWFDSDNNAPNAALHFWSGTAWVPQKMTAVTRDPAGTCAAGAFAFNTAEADFHRKVSWCDAAGNWRKLFIDVSSSEHPYAALFTAANATRYRITGITVEPFRIPATYGGTLPTGNGTGNGDQKTAQTQCLAYTRPDSQDITFDRMIFDGVGYPNRTRRAFCFWEGRNIALVDSSVKDINYWRPAGALETTPSAIINFHGGGPFLFRNNAFENCSGICIMFSDDAGSAVSNPADITAAGNRFYVSAKLNMGDSTTNGRRYDFRHFFELKRGERVKLIGNEFVGGFPITNQGAQIGITPRPGNCALKQNSIRVADLDIDSNRFRYAAQVLLLTGQDTGQASCNVKNTVRVAVRNNVVENTGVTESGGTMGGSGLQLNGQVINAGLGLQDFAILRNVFAGVSSACCNANLLSHGWDAPGNLNSRLWIAGNIYTSLAVKNKGYWGIMGNGLRGAAALNALWKAGNAPSYSVTGNVMQSYFNGDFPDGPPDGAYPAGNLRTEKVSDFAAGLQRCANCGDLLAVRPKPGAKLVARGKTPETPGPDFAAFDAAQGYFQALRVSNVGAAGATVEYRAPDAAACTVEYGTDASALTGQRVADAGGANERVVNLTGLTAGAAYHARVWCRRMDGSVSFTTK